MLLIFRYLTMNDLSLYNNLKPKCHEESKIKGEGFS